MKKRVVESLILIAAFIIFLLYPIISFFFRPKINLKNKKTYIINYKEKYTEPGYYVTYRGKKIKEKVRINGNVNSKKLGIYKITYSIKNKTIPIKTTRVVKIRDIEKPSIIFNEKKEPYNCPNSKYQIEKFQATDNYDGKITKNVKISKIDNNLRYSVADSSGNYIVKYRKVIYKDVEKPSLVLNGNDIMTTYLNEEFIDPSFSVTDNCDKNITKKVKVIGSVDTTKAGTYTITYKVKDKSKNKTELKRTVLVNKKEQPGTIYLTFDDGPKSGTTNVILDILRDEGVKATFFVTNKGPDDLIKREFDEGHSIGLHTASHNYQLIYSSTTNYFNDLEEVHNRVLNLTGIDSRVIRFPGGSSNTISKKYSPGIMSTLTRETLIRGYKYYDWNINSGDAGLTTDKNEEYKNVINHLSHDKVNIVLMHDIKPHTRDALKKIIDYGKSNGYRFDKITNETEMMTQKVNN